MDRYDLHVHSTFSDGGLTPFELIDQIKKIGFSGLSITDHDTIEAYSEPVFEYAKSQGIGLLPGIEFSSYFKEDSVHVLGYGFDIHHEAILGLCASHQERRKERNQQIVDLLAKKGMIVDLSVFLDEKHKSIGRPHIAELMKLQGYVASEQEAFNLWIGDGCPCFAKGSVFTMQESIDVIRKSGGKAVLAHPILLRKRRLIRNLIPYFDGIECHYARFPENQLRDIISETERLGLLKTGGSDFHGEIKPFNPLGCSYTPSEVVAKLYGKTV